MERRQHIFKNTAFITWDLKKTFRIYLCEKKGKMKFHEEKFFLFFFNIKRTFQMHNTNIFCLEMNIYKLSVQQCIVFYK